MNYKLEKFWNIIGNEGISIIENMNYKLEKFWNTPNFLANPVAVIMNYKLEKFWNAIERKDGFSYSNEL